MHSEIIFSSEALLQFSSALLEASGVSPANAALMADSLIAANLRGVDTHGVQLLPMYIERMDSGDVDLHASGHVVSENGSAMVYDGEKAIGQVVSASCTDHAIRLSRAYGFGMVVARESSHFGAAAYWAQRLADAGLIGIVMCNASPSIAPWQGREGRYGTNPICMAVPSAGRGAWLLDMATTTIARGKLFKAIYAGESTIPAGWAMDRDGVPTTDTLTALNGLTMPLGGYKGTGLGIMVEILCAVLAGGGMLTDLGGIAIPGKPLRVSQMFLGIDVARFIGREEFQQRMEFLVDSLKSSKPATGYDEVLVAGEPEARMQAERLLHGIPIEPGLWGELVKLARDKGVPLPVPAQAR